MKYLRVIAIVSLGLLGASSGAEPNTERGDQLEAAVKANDAKALKALLVPQDRLISARYRLSSDPANVSNPIDNLLSGAEETAPESFHALIDYGIWIDPRRFEGLFTDLSYIKDHYPDFRTTLGVRCLEYAAKTGSESMADRFLKAGVAPNAQSLANAVRQNHANVVKVLVKAGAPHDGLISLDEESVRVDEYARRTMKFAVVEALGLAGSNTSPEFLSAFKARTLDPAVPVGLWSFEPAGISFDLQADGSGLMFLKSVGSDAGEPVLWVVKTGADGSSIAAVSPVPGVHKSPLFSEVRLGFGDGGLVLKTRDGLQPGVLKSMDEEQRRTMESRQASITYAGPTGKWLPQPAAGTSPEERQMAERTTLEIAKDGSAVMVLASPDGKAVSLKGRMNRKGEDFILTLEGGAPPMTVKLKDSGNGLLLMMDNQPEHQVIFVKGAPAGK